MTRLHSLLHTLPRSTGAGQALVVPAELCSQHWAPLAKFSPSLRSGHWQDLVLGRASPRSP